MKPKCAKKKIPIYDVRDLPKGRKSKPVGWMSDPDMLGVVMVDRDTLLRLCKAKRS